MMPSPSLVLHDLIKHRGSIYRGFGIGSEVDDVVHPEGPETAAASIVTRLYSRSYGDTGRYAILHDRYVRVSKTPFAAFGGAILVTAFTTCVQRAIVRCIVRVRAGKAGA